MNQNLLIVDDESEILTWLAELFRYEFDIELSVYTANSALEAIKLLAKVRFDVVLTDIRMPGMDGITLFNHIKENWPRCKTVFLTGYRNFEDVYRIINHQDVKYILKSEDDDVIMNAVREFLLLSRQELEQEQHRKEQEDWLEEAKYWLKREFMDQICEGNLPENPGSRMEMLGIPLDAEKEVLPLLLRIEKDWKKEQIQERLLQGEALARILQENVPLKLKFYVHIMENNQGLLLVQPVGDAPVDWQMVAAITHGAVEYAQEQFRNLYDATVSAVVAPDAVCLSELAGCLRKMTKYMIGYIGGAREAILKMEILELPDTENTSAERTGMERSLPDSTTWITSLRNLLEMRKEQDYFSLLGKYLRKMTESSSRHDATSLEIYYSISIFLLQFINENHLNEQLAFRLGIYKLTMADAHENWMVAADYLTEVSQAIFSLLETNESNLADHALQRVVAYIDNHLEDELSLTTLAEVGGFNASYLSRLFKQLQKETLSDFILHKRMDLAKDLLANTNEKIQDVAAKTGYLSPHSFTRAFRNEVGISPTEYRELKMDARSNPVQLM